MSWYFLTFFQAVALAAPIYLLMRRPWNKPAGREWAMAFFFLFMTGLMVLALSGDYLPPAQLFSRAAERLKTMEDINLKPFRTIRQFFYNTPRQSFLINIVGNIVMFIPWGFCLPLLWKKNQRVGRLILWSFFLTLGIETIQLFIARHVDVDDLLLNFLGGLLGGLLWLIFRAVLPGLRKLAK